MPSFLSRRRFLATTTSASALALTPNSSPADQPATITLPPAFANLKPLGTRIRPILAEDFRDRLVRAQNLMSKAQPAYDALFLAPGTSLYYFTGVHWGLSERLLGLVIPRSGRPILIVPAFEEARLREKLRFPLEVRTWQEDQSPAKLAASALTDRNIRTGRLGVEESVPFTFFDHLKREAPAFEYVSADRITIALRAHKSPQELALMRLACDATFDVFRAVFASLQPGMSQSAISSLAERGFAKMNLSGESLVLLGASAALPHGTLQPQSLKEGDVVLIDGGCTIDGYQSDVTRTSVFGKPSAKQLAVFEIVRKAQDAALAAARPGQLSGSVDDAARSIVTTAGYGPDYKFFTHRLGHGLGLDGHEHPYLVRGSTTTLEPGMTFSNEPGIYIPGEFGIRCEDDMVIAPDGPAQLLTKNFAISLEKPFG